MNAIARRVVARAERSWLPALGYVRRQLAVQLRRRCSVGITDQRLSDGVELALSAVDAVHRVPRTAPLLHVRVGLSPTELGLYDADEPCSIEIYSGVADPALTFLHELGHHLDLRVLGTPIAPASSTAALAGWLDAVRATTAVQRLLERYWRPVVIEGVSFYADVGRLGYYLEVEELFARSYAQYIVLRSGHQDLTAELAAAPQLGPGRDVLYPEQWDAADFPSVASALDKVLQRKRWSR